MEWSRPVLLVPGKSDRNTETTMTLVRHLQDAADVAGVLWDAWVPTHIQRVIASDLPDGLEGARTLFVWLAGVHDIGKATPAFCEMLATTSKLPGVVAQLERAGFDFPMRTTSARWPRHEKLSMHILRSWLKTTQPSADSYTLSSIAGIVGIHHGTPTTAVELQVVGDWQGGTAWRTVQDEIAESMARHTGALDRLPGWLERDLPIRSQVLLAGLVVVADWLASDTHRFPYELDRPPGLRARDVVTEWDLPRPWVAPAVTQDSEAHLAARFPMLAGSAIRTVQADAVVAARTARGAMLMIIEAGMGTGKTEAALLAAEVIAHERGSGGLVFALPTQATSDGIFPRLVDWVGHLPGDARTSVSLAHGKAALNADYQRLATRRLAGVGDPDDVSADAAGRAGADTLTAAATAWLRGRRKATLANFVVCTIDQILFLALQTRHVPMRHSAFAGKVVILDEVHAADTFMRVYLERALAWLAAHETPVILLSATLPPATRESLVGAWCKGAGMPVPSLSECDIYPRITRVDCGGPVTLNPVATDAAVVNVSLALASDSAALERVEQAVQIGGCVGVIRNTVAVAQQTYDDLVARLGEDRVVLIHSGFVSIDRQRIEDDLRRWLGRPGPEGVTPDRPRGLVVVGTQILEQSLDIDFDLLVSDIAPIDLVLQRVGRLHRHQRGPGEIQRPSGLRNQRLILLGARLRSAPDADSRGVEPWLARHNVAVYGTAALLRSLAVLAECLRGRPLSIPEDIAPLVRIGYDPAAPPPPGWEIAWAEADAAEADHQRQQRAKAEAFLLKPPHKLVDFRDWFGALATDPDENPNARAQVRDTEDTVEVIVVCRDGAALRAFPGSGISSDVDLGGYLEPPRDDIARRLAGCTLRLPTAMTAGSLPGGDRGAATAYARIDAVIRDLERQARGVVDGWSQSPWLRGQLPLILDEDMRATVAGWALEYDRRRGLRRSRVGRDAT